MLKKEDDSFIENRESTHLLWNIIRYAAVLFASVVYAYLFGGFFPYTLLYLVISLPVLSLLHLVVTCSLFRMSERLNERIFVKGEYASYHLVLQNSTFFYIPYITVRMYMEGQIICKSLKSMRLSLAPFTTREFQYDIPLLYRGRYDIGVKNVRIHDLIGLFSYAIYPFERKSILVKPRIMNIRHKDVNVSRMSEGKLNSVLNEAGNDDILNIREYAYGDSFRKIHWKLSSKLGKTMVKETRNELDNDVLILLNLQKSGLLDENTLLKEDCLIEELVSQINFLLDSNVSVRLCFYMDGPVSLKAENRTDFNRIYQLISEIKFNQVHDFNQVIDFFSDTEQSGSLVYIFTLTLDGDNVTRAFNIKNKGCEPEIYYVNLKGVEEKEETASQELADMLAKNNIRAFKLEPVAIHNSASHKEVTAGRRDEEVEAYEA